MIHPAFRIALLLIVALVVVACSYPTRNQPLTRPIHPIDGYRGGQVLKGPLSETLIILTISGGGMRAAALGYGTMRALSSIELKGDGKSLLHAVDIVSSVSGGSVPAAYLALKGPEQLDSMRTAFLNQDGTGRLAWRILNPYGLLKVATAGTERIDPLIDWLDETLFDGATYKSLRNPEHEGGWHRPYLIINAADMAAEAPFPFHQSRFDLLCSDLEQLPLAVAVAASAAFPLLLSPITLVNYSEPDGCRAQRDAIGGVWPPQWIRHTDNDPAASNQATTSIYTNPSWVLRARTGESYIGVEAGELRRPFIHLLDGGIADNLGLAEPIRLLTTRDTPPSLLNYIDNGQIKRILLLVVNARSDPDSDLDRSKATPGILQMLGATTGSAIDNTSFGRLQHVREIVLDLLEVTSANDSIKSANERAAIDDLKFDLGMIDFEMIGDPQCRQHFKNIPTSWSLESVEVDALIDVAEALMWRDPGFRKFITRHQGEFIAPDWVAAQEKRGLSRPEQPACQALLSRAED